MFYSNVSRDYFWSPKQVEEDFKRIILFPDKTSIFFQSFSITITFINFSQEKSFQNSLKDFTIDPLSLEFVPSLQSLELDDSKSSRVDKSPRSAQKSPRANKSPRGDRPDANKSPRIRPQLRGKNGTDLKLLLQEHFSNDSALPQEVQTSPRPMSNRPASRSKSKPLMYVVYSLIFSLSSFTFSLPSFLDFKLTF